MSLSDIDLASLIDIYSRDDCVAVFRSQVAECLRELQSLRASQTKVVEALHGLNAAIDEMWNDVHRFQHWSAHQQLICAAQQAAATALAEKHGVKE